MGQSAPGPGKGPPRVVFIRLHVTTLRLGAPPPVLTCSPTATPISPLIMCWAWRPPLWQSPKGKGGSRTIRAIHNTGSAGWRTFLIRTPASSPLGLLGPVTAASGADRTLCISLLHGLRVLWPTRGADTLPGHIHFCRARLRRAPAGDRPYKVGALRSSAGWAGVSHCAGAGAAAAGMNILAFFLFRNIPRCFHIGFDLLTGDLTAFLTAALLQGKLLRRARLMGVVPLPKWSLAFSTHCLQKNSPRERKDFSANSGQKASVNLDQETKCSSFPNCVPHHYETRQPSLVPPSLALSSLSSEVTTIWSQTNFWFSPLYLHFGPSPNVYLKIPTPSLKGLELCAILDVL